MSRPLSDVLDAKRELVDFLEPKLRNEWTFEKIRRWRRSLTRAALREDLPTYAHLLDEAAQAVGLADATWQRDLMRTLELWQRREEDV